MQENLWASKAQIQRVVDPKWHLLWTVHDVLAFAALVNAIVQLARLPNVEPPVFFYFAPPLMAWLFLVANTGKFNSTALLGCRIFLSMVAVSTLLAEQQFVVPNLKPQFPGLAPLADRILTFYFFAYGLFLGVMCPSYVLGTSLFHRGGGNCYIPSRWILYSGCVCWLGTMVVLVVLVTNIGKFF